MKLNAVHHVALIVPDYEKSRDFHVNKLGFEIVRENHRPERHDYKLDLKCGTIELEISGNKLSDPDYVALPKRVGQPEYHMGACGLRYLAFYVNDVDAYKAGLESMGIYVQPVRYDDYTGEKVTFFFDPDDPPLELHEQFSRR